MRPGPEGQSRVEYDVDRRGVRRRAPGRYDPQPLGDPYRRELRLAHAHPVVIGDRGHRVLGKRLAERSRSLHQRVLGVAGSAEERRQPDHRPARLALGARLTVDRRFSSGARARVGRVNGQRAGFQQRVGPAFRGVRSRVEGQSTILRRRLLRHRSCASPSAARDNGSTCRHARKPHRGAAPGGAECWS